MNVSIDTAKRLQQDYRCAGCWGNVSFVLVSRDNCEMHCKRCGVVDQFVSRHYVEERRAMDAVDASDAKRNLAAVLGITIETNQKTAEEIIQSLGF
ncbi:MAG TPA: hypothetical protein PLL41_08240 [Smithella sp.]|nr:hypothetical protein [Smithella sp.]